MTHYPWTLNRVNSHPPVSPELRLTCGNSKMALWLVGDEAVDYRACYGGVLLEYTTAETAPADQEISFLI